MRLGGRRTRLPGGLALPALGALCWAASPARAQRWELAADARLGGVAIAATSGQLGSPDPGSRCGPDARTDLGVAANATGVALLTTARARYQLALSGGYFQFLCTPAMTRPVGGLDFRGEHRLGSRTVLSTSLRGAVDQFDRSLDLRLGLAEKPMDAPAGNPFLTASAGVEIEHTLAGRYGLRAGLSAQTLQLLVPVDRLSVYSSLGPMVVAELSATPFKDTVRERFEIPLRYQVGHYYAATFQGIPGVPDRGAVPLSQDLSASFAWELRPSPLWSVRLSGGLAAAYQPNLCVQLGREEIAADSCSINRKDPGIRGAESAPPLEVALGRRATGTFIGEAGVVYHDRRRLFEVRIARGYEPSAYAGALVLSNRLSGNGRWRVTPDLVLLGSLQLAQLGGSSPARVIDGGDPMGMMSERQLVSPQNRDFLAAQGGMGVDWFFLGPLALFAQVDFGVFAIKGVAVGDSDDPQRRISAFPLADQPSAIARVSTTLGLRIAARPSPREPDLLQTARALP